ncbi:MAG: flagellar hook-associated protein FlgL [Planctomycetes bacterium]|nr:flagellar hook-associated protein FlgL [Planctomycetota bacterium]
MNWARRDIRSNALELNTYREQLSTGKRINRPSDDPSSFLRILPLQNDIANVRRFIDNAEIADETFTTASASLEEVSSLMAEAKRLAVQGANGTLSASDRSNLGAAVDQILRQIVGIANSKLGDRYLFSGTAASRQPFELIEVDGLAFVRYFGTDNEVTIEVAPGTETVLTSSGRKVFLAGGRGDTRYLGNSGVAAGTGTDSGTGRGRLHLEHTGFTGLPAGIAPGAGGSQELGNLSYITTAGPPQTISINGGPISEFDNTSTNLLVETGDGRKVYLDMSAWTPATISGSFQSEGRMSWDDGRTWTNIDFSSTNQQLVHSVTGEVVNIDSTGIDGTGLTEIRFDGTFDPFNSLVALRDLLRDEDGLGPELVSERLTDLIGDIDNAAEVVLESLRDVGARGSQMELTKTRMNSLEVTLMSSLSREEDVDLAETILRMTQADTSYQASLQVGSRVIQRTLLDYLR